MIWKGFRNLMMIAYHLLQLRHMENGMDQGGARQLQLVSDRTNFGDHLVGTKKLEC